MSPTAPVAPAGLIPTTLVTGPNAQAREDAIARLLQEEQADAAPAATATVVPDSSSTSRPNTPVLAILLEGLPALQPVLPSNDPAILSVRIAPGCVCCSGNLVMQVTLNRLLRSRPKRLFIALASTAHLEAIQDFLARPPYDTLLRLTPLVSA